MRIFTGHLSVFHFCLFSCRLRILDSFGTDPEFNYAEYKHAAKFKTGWGKPDVHVRQMMTMFRKYKTDLKRDLVWGVGV